jgi:uncharacterized protein YkwD
MMVASALLANTPSTTASRAPQLHPVEQNIVQYTNAERQRNGLPPLTIDHSLMSSARRHCAWMARSGSLVHTTGMVAENIAMGQQNSLHAVKDWMNSPGHRANMLGGYTRIGAAAYTGAGGQVFWCVQFLR